MAGVWVERTPAARHFRDKAGYANFRLNTIVVGLEGVKQGTAIKPPDLAVRWQPKDVVGAANLARGFATNAVMVYVVDALDNYMMELASSHVWIKNPATASILHNDFQIDRSGIDPITDDDRHALLEAIRLSPQAELEARLRDFSAKHFGRRKRPSMRTRFEALCVLVGDVPEHYTSAVQLLISWRNRHVHGRSTERIPVTLQSSLNHAAALFYVDHAHLDVGRMIDNYDAGSSPTLKEVSSLIAVLHRVITSADRVILRSANASEAFLAALRAGFSDRRSAERRIKEYWGKDVSRRQAKLIAIVKQFGFRTDAVPPEPPLTLSDQEVRAYAEMDRDDFSAIVLPQQSVRI